MVHGTPDYGVTSGKYTVYQVTDLGELAARLGSIDTFDRGGDVMFLDGFEDGIAKYETIVTGTGAAVAASTDTARNGAYSVAITTSATNGERSGIRKYLTMPNFGSLGIEISFTIASQDHEIQVYSGIHDGSYQHVCWVRYLTDESKFQYIDENGNWADLSPGVSLMANAKLFHTLKLVFNTDTEEYERLICNNQVWKMTGTKYWKFSQVIAPKWWVNIYVATRSATSVTCYIDDLILTQNEPI